VETFFGGGAGHAGPRHILLDGGSLSAYGEGRGSEETLSIVRTTVPTHSPDGATFDATTAKLHSATCYVCLTHGPWHCDCVSEIVISTSSRRTSSCCRTLNVAAVVEKLWRSLTLMVLDSVPVHVLVSCRVLVVRQSLYCTCITASFRLRIACLHICKIVR